MVSVDGLRKSYGKQVALDGVSFEVAAGSCFGLLGPNGAGKSTTISIIVGTLRPDSGSVKIEGRAVTRDTDPLRKRIGYVPQDLALYEDLTALDNLALFGALYEVASIESRTAQVLDLVGLSDRARTAVKTYSGGMKRRLNIALALLHDPDLIILDEPTVGVDPQSRNAIFDTLETLKGQGKTLIYTTHYMEEVERMCDHIAIIDHGKVVSQGTLAELLRTLPAASQLTVTLASPELAARARDVLGLPNAEGDHVAIPAPNIAETIKRTLDTLQAQSIPFEDLQTHQGSLEEVFLACTGRSLRDE
jgi:ABC-2 type transport system ATP-binding protein